eukprot:CAMPEP_0194272840 /NCGR_PEP_ID=MMETSP0169-20130528/6302_1 /TAXON_ID=218684 /ORGANISM="Corethron pennatum, Strain L29A3" /LENGTH=334 /DNA_ID=CAMNT_0039015607 /DNA_START=40 /DNA_END=1044 /DNA_ORIENTATION=+
MKLLLSLSLLLPGAAAFTSPACLSSPARTVRAPTFLSAAPDDSSSPLSDRRAALRDAAALAAFIAAAPALPVLAADAPAAGSSPTRVVVAGATGQTGRRILERLANSPSISVVAGVRNVEKATASLSESSTVVRGAMVQKVGSVDTAGVTFAHIDVVQDKTEAIAGVLQGADSLVIATGFIPGNPLKMTAEAHKVDNLGTIRLVDAAKMAGVRKIVLVSSILTNGREWGQEKSAGFVITNAFGQVLDEKIVAEKYLRASGLDYTIVRPGGLKAKPPTGQLKVSAEDTLNSGEISRDLVADVCVAAISDRWASNKVLEIIEDDGTKPKAFNGLNM